MLLLLVFVVRLTGHSAVVAVVASDMAGEGNALVVEWHLMAQPASVQVPL